MQDERWKCPKCDFHEFDADEISATGGMFSNIFGAQTKKFDTKSCQRCGYTEIYKTIKVSLGNIFNFDY